jgi:phage gp45-like
MKTNLIAIFTVIVTVLGIANSTQAAVNNNNNAGVVLTDISKINKIEVYGNVKVYVSNGDADQVKVYNRYYSESALVQSRNGVLRISSYKAEKLEVWVTAKELNAITAYDNAEVKSFGNLSAIELDVKLYNNASADLKLDAFSAAVTMNDKTRANLSGNVSEYSLNRSVASSVNRTHLVADHSTEITNGIKAKASEYAFL